MWLLVLGGLVYLAAVFIPAYAQYYEVKRVLSEATHLAITEPDDDDLRQFVIDKCAELGSHPEMRGGVEENVPDVILEDKDVTVVRNEERKSIRIQAVYQKKLLFPFTSYRRMWRRVVTVQGDLNPVKW